MKTQHFLTTKELADLLRVKERKIYELAGAGEIPCRRVTGKLLFPRDEIDAWLGGSALVSAKPSKDLPHVIAGSHDPLLDWAIRESGCGIATFFDGSINGLDQMQQGQAIAAGIHLVEQDGKDWNRSFVDERFSSAPMVLMEWAKRQQGMILSPACQNASSLIDLKGRRIAQRQPTAGAHILFNYMIAANGCAAQDFQILPELVRTETEAAVAVASGAADAAPGLAAVAKQFNLGFMPTMLERYDLIIDRHAWFEPPMQCLLEFCRSEKFQNKTTELSGYETSGHGNIHWNGA